MRYTQFHKETTEVIKLVIGGKKDTSKNSIAAGSDFKLISAELTKLMTQWKNSL